MKLAILITLPLVDGDLAERVQNDFNDSNKEMANKKRKETNIKRIINEMNNFYILRKMNKDENDKNRFSDENSQRFSLPSFTTFHLLFFSSFFFLSAIL